MDLSNISRALPKSPFKQNAAAGAGQRAFPPSTVICLPNLSAAISKNDVVEFLRSKGFEVVEADLRPNYWFPCQTLLAELVDMDESARAIQELQNVEIMGQKYSAVYSKVKSITADSNYARRAKIKDERRARRAEQKGNRNNNGVMFRHGINEEDIHPLSPKWKFWLWIDKDNWTQCLEEQCEIGSIEDFVALKHKILPPSRMPQPGQNYHIFKAGIKPMWEDPCNRGGGSIDIVLGRQHQFTKLDRLWFELLMAALGNQFEEHNDKICGVSFRNRKHDYALSLWISDASSYKAYGPIIGIVEAKLGIIGDSSVSINVQKHPSPGQQQMNMNTSGEQQRSVGGVTNSTSWENGGTSTSNSHSATNQHTDRTGASKSTSREYGGNAANFNGINKSINRKSGVHFAGNTSSTSIRREY